MTKKILIPILILLVILAVAAIGFYLFRNNDTGGSDGGLRVGNFFGLFPGGDDTRPIDDGGLTTDGGGTFDGGGQVGSTALLRQLSSEPVAGAVTVSNDIGTSSSQTMVRYIERATGHTFEVDPRSLNKKRLTNTTIPSIYEALWSGDGKRVILRYLNSNDVIKTFSGRIGESDEGALGELIGEFLPDDIPLIVTTPKKDKILYLISNNSDVAGVEATFDNKDIVARFESPFGEWLIDSESGGDLTLTTKASGFVPGYVYFVESRRVLSKILGGVNGLTTKINQDGSFILYSESSENAFTLHSLDITSRADSLLDLTALPEKCVWSNKFLSVAYCAVSTFIPAGTYPDDWYQGNISFTDEIYEMDIERGINNLLVSLSTVSRQDIDAINLMLDENEEFLVFMNKNDSTLWSLEL